MNRPILKSAMSEPRTPWPHAPTHQLSQAGTYFVTASTLEHAHHFRSAKRLGVLQRGLLGLAGDYGWRLETWAVFSNHYHFVGHSPEAAADASNLIDHAQCAAPEWASGSTGWEGGRHSIWVHRETRKKSALPRHSELREVISQKSLS